MKPIRVLGLSLMVTAFSSLAEAGADPSLGLFGRVLYSPADDVVAVSSRVSNGYARHRLRDGSFQPEYYVFGEGGIWQGAARDATADKMNFLSVAHTIAHPLADQNYLPGKDPKTTALLIKVFWGTTQVVERADESPPYVVLQTANEKLQQVLARTGVLLGRFTNITFDPYLDAAIAQADAAIGMVAAENRVRDRRDEQNASMLGYDSWWATTSNDPALGPVRLAQRQIMIDELEDERYFVVLVAYDWQALVRHKQRRLLWETRYSLRSRGHAFDADLAAMTKEASKYFGRSSDGLVHDLPDGHVSIGELKTIDDSATNK